MANPNVAVVMGSDSDWPTMQACVAKLRDLGLTPVVEIMSAHRSPQRVREFSEGARPGGIEVIIAAAGMSAALAGVIAAHTTLPVIGVPIASGPLNGIDALLSTVQMPPGVPVAGVAIGSAGAQNAAILAAQIVATRDESLRATLEQMKSEQADAVDKKNKALMEKICGTSA